MYSSRFLPLLAAVLLAGAGLFLLVGCDSTDSGTRIDGRFVLRLTDAPADLQEAVVTVNRVDLIGADGIVTGEADEVVTLMETSRQLDLLELQNGVTETLADVPIPEGSYSQLRFVLGAENYVVVGGERQNLTVPSGLETGVKIVLPDVEVAEEGDRVEVTLDFDVEDSFILAGDGRYLLRPTVKVKEMSVNGDEVETVEVEGAVTAASATSVSVDEIPFEITDRTEFEDDGSSLDAADLTVGQFVEVEGTMLDDGSLRAREVELADEGDDGYSIEAHIESVAADALTLLGVTIDVDATTAIEGGDFSSLVAGEYVEVEYDHRDGRRVAVEIEMENDE